jgi:hypothetical protein
MLTSDISNASSSPARIPASGHQPDELLGQLRGFDTNSWWV